MESDLHQDREVAAADAARLFTIYCRGGSAPCPTLGNLKWLGKSVRLLEAVSASLKD
jgi:hypothetical protein